MSQPLVHGSANAVPSSCSQRSPPSRSPRCCSPPERDELRGGLRGAPAGLLLHVPHARHGAAPTNEQNTRCNTYFGARALTTIKRLNALLVAFNADPASGRLTDQTANLLGPGFICAAPKLSTSEVDAYAYSSLPGPGLVEATGPCGLEPVAVNGSPLILNCALGVKPIPSKNVLGGLITSNSLVNLLEPVGERSDRLGLDRADRRRRGQRGGGGGTVPARHQAQRRPAWTSTPAHPRDEQTPNPDSFDCTITGLAGPAIAVRTAGLWVAQPDATTGRIPDTPTASIGKLTVCYVRAISGGYRAFALAELKAGGKSIKVTARGDCRTTTRAAAGADLRGQTCALSAQGRRDRRAHDEQWADPERAPASAADHGVWSLALFGVPTA